MEVILNADIARLVLGYLKDQNLHRAFREYCRTSPYLKEEYDVMKNGFIPINLTKGSLIEILREYCEIKSLVYHFIDDLPSNITNDVNRQSNFKKKLEVLFDVITNKILDHTHENLNKRKRSYSIDISDSSVNDLESINDTKRKKLTNESFIFLNDRNYCRHDTNLNCTNCNTKLQNKIGKTPNKIKDDIVCNLDKNNDIVPGFSVLSETILENPEFQNKLVLNINKILSNVTTTSLTFDTLNIHNDNKDDSELDLAIKNILHETEHDSVFDAIIQEAVCSKVDNSRDRTNFSTPVDNTNDDVSIKQRLRKFAKPNNNVTTENININTVKNTKKKEKCKILSNQSLVPTLVKVINTPEPNLQQIVWVPNTSLSDANRKLHKKSTSVIVPASIPIPLEFSNVSTTNEKTNNNNDIIVNEENIVEKISSNESITLNKSITPKTNVIQNIKTKSFSTPRRRASHIRVLNFKTPPKHLDANISCKNSKLETVTCSPAQVVEISTSAPHTNDDTKLEQRRSSTELNGDWDFVQGMGTIIKCNNSDEVFNTNLNLNTNLHSCTPKVKKNTSNCATKLPHDASNNNTTTTTTMNPNHNSDKKKPIEPKALEEWKQMRSIPAGEWDQHIRQIERESLIKYNKNKKRRRPTIKSSGSLQLPKLRGKKNIALKKLVQANDEHEETLEDILLGNTCNIVQAISEISSTQNNDDNTEEDDDDGSDDDVDDDGDANNENGEQDEENDKDEIILNDDTKLINYTKEYKAKQKAKQNLTTSTKKRNQSPRYKGQNSAKKKIMNRHTPKKPEELKNVKEGDIVDYSTASCIIHNNNEDNNLEIEIENLHSENSEPKTTNDTSAILLNEGDIILPIDFNKECNDRLPVLESNKSTQFQICLSSLLDTPFKMDETVLNSFPITPRFIDPNSLDTPLPRAGFSRTSNLSVLKDHEFPTPSFPITPHISTITTPPLSLDKSGRSGCPTDYSSSSSYYKPDESDDLDNKLDAMLYAQRTKTNINKDTENDNVHENPYINTDADVKLNVMDYEYSGTLLAERKHLIDNIELTDNNELQIIENKDNLNIIDENAVVSIETAKAFEVIVDQIEDTKYSDLLIETEPKRVECPGILERIKSFEELQKTTNISTVETSSSVVTSVPSLAPHYTLMPGIANDEKILEKDSSSDSHMNSSSSSSSSSSTSSDSSSCSSDSEFDDKSDNSKDKDWKLKKGHVNDNNKLFNENGEVRYPVRSWITPKKENINTKNENNDLLIRVETKNELHKRELEEKRLRIVAKLKKDSLKRYSSKPAIQQVNATPSTTPTTSTMVTNTKKPVIKRKLTSTISSSAKAQSITLNKPTSNLIVSQSKISASPSKRKTSTPRKVVYIDNFPAKFKTTLRTSTITSSNISNDNFQSLRYSSDSIESPRSFNEKNKSQTPTSTTMILNEKIKTIPKELLKISNAKLQDNRRRKIVSSTSTSAKNSVRKKLSPKSKSSIIVNRPHPKITKKITKPSNNFNKAYKDVNEELVNNELLPRMLEKSHSASQVKINDIKENLVNDNKAEDTTVVKNIDNSDTTSETDLYDEFETSCHDEISKKNYYHFIYNENENIADSDQNKLAFITKGEKYDFDGLVMNIFLEDDDKLTCKLTVEKEIKIFKRKPLVKKQLESSCTSSSAVPTVKLQRLKKKTIGQKLIDNKTEENVISSPKFSIKFRESISDKKNDSISDNKIDELEDFQMPVKKKKPLSSTSTSSDNSKLAIEECNKNTVSKPNAGSSLKVSEKCEVLQTVVALPGVSNVQKQIKVSSKMPLKIDMKRRNTKVTSPKKPPTSEFDINAVLNMVHGSQN